MQGEMEDKCGIVGIHAKDSSKDVAPLVYYCLYALQHRGQLVLIKKKVLNTTTEWV